MTSVKNALSRKFGPAPAWVWAIVVGVGLYFIRRSAAGGSGGLLGGSGTDPGATLGYYGPYGQSYYPIQGQVGGGGGVTPATNGSSGSPAAPPPVINITPLGEAVTPAPPGKSTIAAPVRPRYAPAGSRHTGPQSPGKGWRGIGGGWWAPPTAKHPNTRPRHGATHTASNPGSRPKAKAPAPHKPTPKAKPPRPAPRRPATRHPATRPRTTLKR